MSASSVTGVGPGSAEGSNKGRQGSSIGVERFIGPHVVAAGAATTATVVLPLLPGSVGDYIAMVTDASGSATAVSATLAFNTNDTTITVDGSTDYTWAIMKVGLATSVA